MSGYLSCNQNSTCYCRFVSSVWKITSMQITKMNMCLICMTMMSCHFLYESFYTKVKKSHCKQKTELKNLSTWQLRFQELFPLQPCCWMWLLCPWRLKINAIINLQSGEGTKPVKPVSFKGSWSKESWSILLRTLADQKWKPQAQWHDWVWDLTSAVGHFRVAFGLGIKTSLPAKLRLAYRFIFTQIKFIFIRKVLPETKVQRNSQMAYWSISTSLKNLARFNTKDEESYANLRRKV